MSVSRIILLRLKQNVVNPQFLSVTMIGEVNGYPSPSDKHIILCNAVELYERYEQKMGKRPDTVEIVLTNSFNANSIVSGTPVQVNREDVLWIRGAAEDDEILTGYNKALEAYRLERSNLISPNRPNPPLIQL
jgi:hypothetical protein